MYNKAEKNDLKKKPNSMNGVYAENNRKSIPFENNKPIQSSNNVQYYYNKKKNDESAKKNNEEFLVETKKNQNLIPDIKSRQDYPTNLNNLNRQIKDLNSQNEQIKMENQKLENEINSLSQVHKNNLQNYEKIVNEYEFKTVNNAKIISQNESYQKEIENLNKIINDLNIQNQRVKYEKSEKSCKTLDLKIEDQNQEIIKLRQEKNYYLTNLNNLNRQIKDLNYQNEQIKIEYQKLENKINSQSQVHKKDLQNYEKTVNEYKLESVNNAKIISQNESYQIEIEKLNKIIDDLNIQNQELKSSQKTFIPPPKSTLQKKELDKISELQEENNKLTSKIQRKNEKIRSLSSFKDKEEGYKQKKYLLKKKNEELQKELEKIKKGFSLRNENNDYSEENISKPKIMGNRDLKGLAKTKKTSDGFTRESRLTSNSSKNIPKDQKPYDIVINIDSLKAKEIGWEIENYRDLSNDEREYSIIGFVGRENIGKTFILNKLCGFNLPSGTNVNTKGLSLKYSDNSNLVCLDSAGIQTPVYYYDKKIMERYNITKEDIKNNEEIKVKMINDRTITDIFIQDFILEICEVIIIIVGQLTQNDQKFIERISKKYKCKKKIIIIHNFSNLSSIEDVESKVQKDIINAFGTVDRIIPSSKLKEYIEKKDKQHENISHLVLGSENEESGLHYNEKTLEYIRMVLDTRIDKKPLDIIDKLTNYLEENYRLYFQFKVRPKNNVTLKYFKKTNSLKIISDQDYEIANPIFNTLGTLITNPPYEVFVRNDGYICLIELPDLQLESIKMNIDKKKTEFACLIVQGIKNAAIEYIEQENEDIIENRKYGEFTCMIPLGPNHIDMQIKKIKDMKKNYNSGILTVEVFIKESIEQYL